MHFREKIFKFFAEVPTEQLLREAPMIPAPEAACKQQYGSHIDKTYVCAGGDGRASCQVGRP
jgi:hypothetical protein